MNYANMIEEKTLKKGFIIATLLSTVMGTFTTGINLMDKVGEKRKQTRRDKGQDDKITALQKQIQSLETTTKKGHEKDEGDLRRSLERSEMIKREYDRDYARLGPRFAQGDVITENQLQSQVIMLQGTVIHLLEDALRTGRIDNINKLYNASEFAREGSIKALQGQYQRMLQAAPISRGSTLSRPTAPVRRISSTPSLHTQRGTVARAPTVKSKNADRVTDVTTVGDRKQSVSTTSGSSVLDPGGPLFCRYSAALQGGEVLDVCFSKGGSNSCPLCGTNIPVEEGRAWKIVKEVVHEKISTPEYDDVVIEDRTFLINNRFVIKCHRESAGFACVLCYRHRDKDTLVESANGLVRHIWQKHDASELDADMDIKEVESHRNTVTQKWS